MNSNDSKAPLVIAQANFHQLWGGQAEVVLSLSKSLTARGHRAIVVAPPQSQLAARAEEAKLETFTGCRFARGFRPYTFFGDWVRLRKFLDANGVQIFHCHGSQDHWMGAFSTVGMGAPPRIVRTRHNIYPVRNHVFNRWLFRDKTAQVITIFNAQAEFFTSTGLLKPENLFTLHSPLPQEFVEARDVTPVLRAELNIPAAAPIVGFVGAFHPDKAPMDFVAAAEQIARENSAVHFCMAGFGPLLEPVKERVATAGLSSRIHVLGFRKDIANVIASFDMVALTSVTREASSTVLKQAGSLSKPVIATDVGGTREVVADGMTGILIPPGEVAALVCAINSLLTDSSRAEAMGKAGRERVVTNFAANAIAERTEELYRSILTGAP
jgi:glycosyltransferase involved in cell wall biosynthesis